MNAKLVSKTKISNEFSIVSKNGRRFFYFRYTVAGKKRSMKLGEYGAMTVAQARKQALACRYQLDQGTDPPNHSAVRAFER